VIVLIFSCAVREPEAVQSHIHLLSIFCRDDNTVMLLKDMNGQTKTCELKGFWSVYINIIYYLLILYMLV